MIYNTRDLCKNQSNLLLDLGMQDLIHNMFHHILDTIQEHHDNKIFSSMESIVISCIEGMDVTSQPIITMLWAIHNQQCIPSIMTCRLVNNLFKHCEEILKTQLHKAKEVGDDNKIDEKK